jgi:hypothetical protein
MIPSFRKRRVDDGSTGPLAARLFAADCGLKLRRQAFGEDSIWDWIFQQ